MQPTAEIGKASVEEMNERRGSVEDIPKLLDKVGRDDLGRKLSEDISDLSNEFQNKMTIATNYVASFISTLSMAEEEEVVGVEEEHSDVKNEAEPGIIISAFSKVGEVTSTVTKEVEKVKSNVSKALQGGVSLTKDEKEIKKDDDVPWKGCEKTKSKILNHQKYIKCKSC